MNLIAIGVIFILAGGGLWMYGDYINNNSESVMRSFFESGSINPGSGFVTFGIICLAIGCLLVLCGVILSVNQKLNSPLPYSSAKNTLDELYQRGVISKEEYDRKRADLKQSNTPQITTERLNKLNSLYQRGIIGQEEYSRKYQEIIVQAQQVSENQE